MHGHHELPDMKRQGIGYCSHVAAFKQKKKEHNIQPSGMWQLFPVSDMSVCQVNLAWIIVLMTLNQTMQK